MVRPVLHKEDHQENVLLQPHIECQLPLATAEQGSPVVMGWSTKVIRTFPVPQTSLVTGLGRAGGWLGQPSGQCYSQSQVPGVVMAPQGFFSKCLEGLIGIHFWQLLPEYAEMSYSHPCCQNSKMPPHHNQDGALCITVNLDFLDGSGFTSPSSIASPQGRIKTHLLAAFMAEDCV